MAESAKGFGSSGVRGALLASVILVPTAVVADDPRGLAIAVGDPQDDSYRIGQALAASLGTPEGAEVELWEALSPSERIMVLLDDVQLAVVPDGQAVPEAARDVIGTVLDAGDGHQLLVAASLDPALAEEVARALGADPVVAAAAPVAAVLPAAKPKDLLGGKSFTVYFGFDEVEMDPAQIATVAQACQYAATLPGASFVLAGHADTMGPELYNDQLSRARAQSVAATIRNDERFKDALNVIEFGENELAIPTGDET
ncbi:MAG: OmpA family protein, partial [Pseudomonadota bacterium]